MSSVRPVKPMNDAWLRSGMDEVRLTADVDRGRLGGRRRHGAWA